ncbi:MAG: protein-glutamate O-methyltransferase CheR [Archangium sp.]|nr:protein-glutamate O-methyltransferase CheR [Archangium sp.]
MSDPSPAWGAVRTFMRSRCGVMLAEDQHYLLDARLGPLARDFSFPSVEAFVATACSASAEDRLRRAVVDAMTTHETTFFRDRPFWKMLEDRIIPGLRAAGRTSLRVWSAACSTGQEPYSLAMLLEELWPEGAAGTQIVATDISEIALEKAREGAFTQLEVNRGLGASRLIRYFEQQPLTYRIKDSLRRRIEWRVDNLLSPLPGPKDCDLVMCRNVLIYFDENDRQQVQRRLRASVGAKGYLGFGATEMSTHGEPLGGGWYQPPAK